MKIKRNLDFSQCSYWGELYELIKTELELPDWCGSNLDALWDAITGIMYVPAEIVITRRTKRADLLPIVDDIIAVFREAEQKYHNITVEIEE